jgi:hypothetical protein
VRQSTATIAHTFRRLPVQMWLGHTAPAFTLRTYVRLLDDGLGDALDEAAWATGGPHEPRATRQTAESANSTEVAV